MGDEVRVEVDLDLGTLSYVVAGKRHDAAFTTLPVDGTEIYPVCAFYGSGRKIRLVSQEIGSRASSVAAWYPGPSTTITGGVVGAIVKSSASVAGAVRMFPITASSPAVEWAFKVEEEESSNEMTCLGLVTKSKPSFKYADPDFIGLRGYNGGLYCAKGVSKHGSGPKFHKGDVIDFSVEPSSQSV